MHGLRNAILAGEPGGGTLITSKEPCRRRAGEASLAGLRIVREERRATNQRREDRHFGVLDRAFVLFRRKKLLVRVVNVSTSGLMVECEIIPWIGEQVGVELEGVERLPGTVRWVKQGRLGIEVSEGSIEVG
jgi:hypothetical protein